MYGDFQEGKKQSVCINMRDQFVVSELYNWKIIRKFVFILSTVSVWIVLLLLRIYQLFLSPFKQLFLGPTCGCRFQPTCSCYAHSAFLKFGFRKGLWLTLWRILRCHPWHPGGFDPLPALNRSDKRNHFSTL